MVEAAIGLGSNVGDKKASLDRAIEALAATEGVRLVARSGYWRTEPWGYTEQDWFVNACVVVETALAPRALLDRCLAIEAMLGRKREIRWGPRLIDLDILYVDAMTLADADLAVPHPHLLERAFVLAPLAEIRPDAVVSGTTIAAALARLDTAGVTRLDWPVPPVGGTSGAASVPHSR
jgi:2-amino-4-hydroxy-6-hydroxymethyldihydropteridine diphosphokinase